jgi:hypothetical protein
MKTLHYNYNRFKQKVLTTGISVFGKKGSTGVVVRCTEGLLNKLYRRTRNSDKSIRIVLLAKSGFIEDMDAAFKDYPLVELIHLRREAIKSLSRVFLPREINDNNYAISGTDSEPKTKYRAISRDVWKLLVARQRFNVVISGNWAYYSERELACALSEIDVPFLVCHKECLKTPSQVRAWIQVYANYRGPFGGRAMSVYNKTEKHTLVESGVCEPEQVVVVGCPRLDELHRLRIQGRKPNTRKTLLFFSFHPTAAAGLPWIPMPVGHQPLERVDTLPIPGDPKYLNHWFGFDESGNLQPSVAWEELSKETHYAILNLAKKRPDIDVLIKVKMGTHNHLHAELLLATDLPCNVKVIRGGGSLEYFQHADAICAFNSTACLEGIAAGIPVVTPRFGEAVLPEAQDCLIELGEAVTTAGSPEKLVDQILRVLDEEPAGKTDLTPIQLDILDEYMGNPDGLAGKRFAEFVLKSVGAEADSL